MPVDTEESVSPWWILLALVAIAGAVAGAVVARNRAARRRWTEAADAALTRAEGLVSSVGAGTALDAVEVAGSATDVRALADSAPDEASRQALASVADSLERAPLDAIEASAALERARTVIGRTGAAHR